MRASSVKALAMIAGVGIVLSGCATFDETAASESEWSAAPELTPERGPHPEEDTDEQGERRTPPREPRKSVPPPDGCTDHDPAVIATCLDTVTAVAAFPGGDRPAALAGERKSGEVFRVAAQSKPTTWARLDVSADGGGGLTGLALSPSYNEDRLAFAYITTERDNRVVRFGKGKAAKPILTGIPKGSSGNAGALALDNTGALLVATGDAGDAKAAADPKSLAGKVLRIDTSGKPLADNPAAGSRIIASGLLSPGGLCASADGSRAWVTDRGASADVLYRIEPGEPLETPVWRWRNRPGVAGCADTGSGVAVAMAREGNLQDLRIDPDGSVTGQPTVSFNASGLTYGRLSGMDAISDRVAIAGTVNKDGGRPVSSDDRVVVLPLQPSPSGGAD